MAVLGSSLDASDLGPVIAGIRRLTVLLFFCSISVNVGCGQAVVPVKTATGESIEKPVWTHAIADLGVVNCGSTLERTFELSNPTLVGWSLVRNPDTNCNCISVDVGKRKVAPGDSYTVRVRFRAPDGPGKFEHSIGLRWKQDDGVEVPVDLKLSGHASANIAVDPQRLHFSHESASVPQSQVISLRAARRVDWSTFVGSGRGLNVHLVEAIDDTRARVEVSQSFTEITDERRFNTTVRLAVADIRGETIKCTGPESAVTRLLSVVPRAIRLSSPNEDVPATDVFVTSETVLSDTVTIEASGSEGLKVTVLAVQKLSRTLCKARISLSANPGVEKGSIVLRIPSIDDEVRIAISTTN